MLTEQTDRRLIPRGAAVQAGCGQGVDPDTQTIRRLAVWAWCRQLAWWLVPAGDDLTPRIPAGQQVGDRGTFPVGPLVVAEPADVADELTAARDLQTQVDEGQALADGGHPVDRIHMPVRHRRRHATVV